MNNTRDENWDSRRRLFLSEDFSNCEILLRSDSLPWARFPCHKSILSTSSEVYAATLNTQRCIEIQNTTPIVIETVLEFIYLEHVEMGDSNFAHEVLEHAHEYKISRLINFCEDYLLKEITMRNVCYVLEDAISFNLEKLKKECLALCHLTGFVVLNTMAFREVSIETVKTILSIPDLQVENEIVVFKAIWEWARYKCCKEFILLTEDNIAAKMSPLLEFIGFEFMSEEEILSIPDCVLAWFLQMCPDVKPGCKYKKDEEKAVLSKHQSTDWQHALFLNETCKDCVFIVTSPKSCARFPCHSTVLGAISDVFVQMLEMVSENREKIFTVEDTCPNIMFGVLKYIYGYQVELDGWRFAWNVFYGACKCDLPGLAAQCIRYLGENISATNVCFLLCNIENFQYVCCNFMLRGGISETVNSRGFLETSQDVLKCILSDKCAKFSNKASLFKSTYKWASYSCCLRRKKVTRDNVWDEMSPFIEFFPLDKMSDEDLEFIPQTALKRIRESSIVGNVPYIDLAPTFSRPTKRRKVDFPLKLSRDFRSFRMTINNSPYVSLEGNSRLLTFSLNRNVFLSEFEVRYIIIREDSRLQSLVIYSKNGTLASFGGESDDNLEMTDSVVEMSQGKNVTFRALKLLPCEAFEIFTIEANRGIKCWDLNWPRVSLPIKKDGDMKMSILTDCSYGVIYMKFIPAS